MDIRFIVITLCAAFTSASQLPPHYYDYEGGMGMMCPPMDCSYLEFLLPCEWEDRYTPRMVMYGMQCDTCPECRDFSYYRSLLNSTLQSTRQMFEKTLVMQTFLTENVNVLQSVSELPETPRVVAKFYTILHRNADVLHTYLALDPSAVVEYIEGSAAKLNKVLSGSNVEEMSGIMYDFSKVEVDNNVESMQDIPSGASIAQMIEFIRQQIRDLSTNHKRIRDAIEEIEPALLTLVDLPEERFESLWMNDRMTLRVAFRLLEKSRDAIESLLDMDMDQTASSLQMVIMEAYEGLLSIWEAPASDLTPGYKPVQGEAQNTSGKDYSDKHHTGVELEGSGDVEGSGAEWEIHEPPVHMENNLFFQWLSSRYVKQV